MTELSSKGKVKKATVEATITRADGRIEKLGIISYYHQSWWRRWAWKLKEVIHGKLFHH